MIQQLLFSLFLMSAATESPVATMENIGQKQVAIDQLQQIYFVDSLDHLSKLDSIGNLLYTYEDKSFPVEHIDTKNGLKTLVYNSQLNIVRFLDRTLTGINEAISLDDLGIPVSHAVGMSRDNYFWVFDENDQSLKKFNMSSQLFSSTGNLTNVLGSTIQPHQLLEKGAHVYLLDSLQGLYQFDYLGTYLFHYKQIKADKIQVMGDQIVFLKNEELFLYNNVLMELKKLSMPNKEKVLDFSLSKKLLLLITEQKIKIYRNNF